MIRQYYYRYRLFSANPISLSGKLKFAQLFRPNEEVKKQSDEKAAESNEAGEDEEQAAREAMKAQRLCDVLKLRPAKKWKVFESIAASRDDALLGKLSMTDKNDCATVAQLMKLMLAEQKKREYEHVATLTRAIRWCFLDNEAVFQALVKGGLGTCILESTKELRARAAECISSKAPTLQLLLASISDMFEWEFFADGDYKQFAEEILLILTSCNDCDDTLYADAACVLMSMCSTSIDSLCKCLVTSKKCATLMEKVLYDLPRAKSFFYEALLLELAYRIHRHGKKTQNERVARVAAKLIDALPVQVARPLPSILPKRFREDTRQLLNEFNLGVGVVKSFKLLELQVSHCGKSKVHMEPTGWIDFGGAALEVEVTAGVHGQQASSTMKLPYKHIQSVAPKDSAHQIVVFVSDAINLAEVVEAVNDQAWSKIHGFSLVLQLERSAYSNAKESLDRRIGTQNEGKLAVIESRTIKREPIEAASDPPSAVQNVEPVQQRCSNHPVEIERQGRERDVPRSNGSHEDRADTKPRERMRREPKQGTIKLAPKPKQITKKRGDPKPTDVHLQRIDALKAGQLTEEPFGKRFGACVVNDSAARIGVENPKARTKVTEVSVRARGPSSHARLSPASRDDRDAVIVPNDEDAPQTRPPRRKQSFRDAQSQQLHQLQALVEDIVRTNDEYREFNISSLCYKVAVQSETLLKRKRQAREETTHFSTASCALHESEATRASEASRRNEIQHAMDQVVVDASSSESKLVESTTSIMTRIETTIAFEWRQDLERVHKRLRTQASQSVAQAKQKLSAIEKTFNTDDLRVMQQMMQRI